MIAVSKLEYDVLSLKWINKNSNATIETEKEKVIEEYGQPFNIKANENINGITLIYDSWNSYIISKC